MLSILNSFIRCFSPKASSLPLNASALESLGAPGGSYAASIAYTRAGGAKGAGSVIGDPYGHRGGLGSGGSVVGGVSSTRGQNPAGSAASLWLAGVPEKQIGSELGSQTARAGRAGSGQVWEGGSVRGGSAGGLGGSSIKSRANGPEQGWGPAGSVYSMQQGQRGKAVNWSAGTAEQRRRSTDDAASERPDSPGVRMQGLGGSASAVSVARSYRTGVTGAAGVGGGVECEGSIANGQGRLASAGSIGPGVAGAAGVGDVGAAAPEVGLHGVLLLCREVGLTDNLTEHQDVCRLFELMLHRKRGRLGPAPQPGLSHGCNSDGAEAGRGTALSATKSVCLNLELPGVAGDQQGLGGAANGAVDVGEEGKLVVVHVLRPGEPVAAAAVRRNSSPIGGVAAMARTCSAPLLSAQSIGDSGSGRQGWVNAGADATTAVVDSGGGGGGLQVHSLNAEELLEMLLMVRMGYASNIKEYPCSYQFCMYV